MDRLGRMVVSGVAALAILTITLYAYLDMQQSRSAPLDSQVVDSCRSLVRQSADILVEVAGDNLQPDDPADAPRLQELQARIMMIEGEMSSLGCLEDPDRWVYGSFKQEMAEYEEYIAELTRRNAEG